LIFCDVRFGILIDRNDLVCAHGRMARNEHRVNYVFVHLAPTGSTVELTVPLTHERIRFCVVLWVVREIFVTTNDSFGTVIAACPTYKHEKHSPVS
jgi:hypothetical protein